MSKKESGEADDNHDADNGDNSDDNDVGNDNEVTRKTEKRGPNNGVQRTVHLRLLTLFASKGFNLSGQCPVSIGFPGMAQVLS